MNKNVGSLLLKIIRTVSAFTDTVIYPCHLLNALSEKHSPTPQKKKTGEGDVGWGVSLTLKNEAVSSFIRRGREEISCFGASRSFLLSQRQGGKIHTIRDWILFL